MKIFKVNNSNKFILAKFTLFYKKQDILIRYINSYIYKKDELIKQKLHTIIIIKDLILIDLGFFNKLLVEIIETINYLQNRLLTKIKSHDKIILKKV